jgi:hypothetical protein
MQGCNTMIEKPELLKIDLLELLEIKDSFDLRYTKENGQKIRTESSSNRSRDYKKSNGSLESRQWMGGVLPKK